MLTDIHVRHLATIDELHLELQSQTTVITGESGAGKSIFIEAIELALGERATSAWVRQNHDKAEITLCFDIQALAPVRAWLKEHDLDHETQECLIRRVISKDGRSRSYINGIVATIQSVRELSEILLHIHGQYEHQALLKPDKQRELLDHYAQHTTLTDTVRLLATQRKNLSQAIQELQLQNKDCAARSEWLKFQLQELNALQLQENEWQSLEEESRKLSHGKDLIEHIQQVLHILHENEQSNVLSQLHTLIKSLEAAQQVDPAIMDYLSPMQQCAIQLAETHKELEHYLEHIDLDPQRLNQLEQRISELYHMARKHQILPEELVALRDNFVTELSTLENLDDKMAELIQQRTAIETEYNAAAEKLSASRQLAADKLAKEITTLIRNLSFPHSNCHIVLEKDVTEFSAHGNEKIIFSIQTNPGQGIQPIAKIASGGELSRISLAIHLATAEQHMIPTLIFDEVDVGISGATSEKVGKLLRRLGKDYQVLCITHHPQVASQGHHHVLVEKSYKQEATFTSLRTLTTEQRTTEVARMLGGEKITQKTLEHAQELVGT